MNDVKSITAVNTNIGWAVRQINNDGTELFILPDIFEPRFSMEHAQLAAESLKFHLEAGGKTYAKPLPANVQVIS